MQRRHALLSLIAVALLCASIAPVYAATIRSNDFNEARWQTWVGYADFSSRGITLIPTHVTNSCKIIYYKTLPQLGYNTTKVYLYYKLSEINWYPESNMDRTFEFWVTNGATEYQIGLNKYNDRFDFRLKSGANQQYKTLNTYMSEGIIAFDSATNIAVLYAPNGTKIVDVQLTGGSSAPLTQFGFITFKASATIQSYALANTLDSVTMAKSTGEISDAVKAFIPVIVVFALLGIVLSQIRKF